MPPTGPLSTAQINLVKLWIDQGAGWPDDVSGDKAPSPGDYWHVQDENAMRAAWRERRRGLEEEFESHLAAEGPIRVEK